MRIGKIGASFVNHPESLFGAVKMPGSSSNSFAIRPDAISTARRAGRSCPWRRRFSSNPATINSISANWPSRVTSSTITPKSARSAGIEKQRRRFSTAATRRKPSNCQQLFRPCPVGVARIEPPFQLAAHLDRAGKFCPFVSDHRHPIDAAHAKRFASLGEVPTGMVVVRIDMLLGRLLLPTHFPKPSSPIRQGPSRDTFARLQKTFWLTAPVRIVRHLVGRRGDSEAAVPAASGTPRW